MRQLAIISVVLLLAAPAIAQNPTFSVDQQGPTAGIPLPDSYFGAGITEGDILTTAPPGAASSPNPPLPGPLPAPGIEIGALPGALGVFPGGLGIIPGLAGRLELDALSYGRDQGNRLYFSVDEFAVGIGGPAAPNVTSEGSGGTREASADVFRYLGVLAPTPPIAIPIGNTAFTDGDGLAPSGLPGVGLVEPNPPTPFALLDPGDNLDAVDVDTTTADLLGRIYFSLDSAFPDPLEGAPINSGTALGNAVSGADVLMTFAGGPPVVAIPAALLGLDLLGFDTDDLDALVFNDADGTASLTPPDTIYFSVRRGSAIIGAPDSAFGIPIEEGDVLTVPAAVGTPPAIFIAAEALGLATLRSGGGPFGADELDALDLLFAGPSTEIPALGAGGQAALALLLLSAGVALGMRRVRLA